MSYQVIARKFRPQTFEQLLGQEHVTVTLRNALKQGRLHHALLFTGPRGTGKTSSARILAKSLRCPNAVDFVPCNACPICEDILVSRSVDVIEIDGASNNGVDAVRELRETVGFMPSSGKYKVYIIDEVHMLSTAAFNALLKTLEEPPAHVVFILATTEVHKLPATIMSRLQRYDFRRIATRVIADHLKMIAQQELRAMAEAASTAPQTLDDDAIWMVARQADGSMRDGQSLLEQVITFSKGELTKENVSSILGLTDHVLLRDSMLAILSRKPQDLNSVFAKFNEIAVDPSLFIENFLQDLRHLMMIRVFDTEALGYIDRPDSEIRLFKDLSTQVEEGDLQILFDMGLKGAQDIQRASEPRWVLEMILLRMASAPRWMDFQQLQAVLGGKSAGAPVTSPMAVGSQMAPRHLKQGPMTEAPPEETIVPPARSKIQADLPPQEKWFEFVQKVKRTDSLLGAKLEPLHFVKTENGIIELNVPSKMSFLKDQLNEKEIQKKITSLLEQLWGQALLVTITVGKEVSTVAPTAMKMGQDKAKQKESELLEQAAQNPKVATFNRIFQGRVDGFAEKSAPKPK